MTQRELNRRVAEATGESVATIAGLGFVPLTDPPYEREPDRPPLVVDWDEWELRRHFLFPPENLRRMNDDTEHKIHVVAGLFVLSCFASALMYGRAMIVICLIELFAIAAILNLFRDMTGGR